jgi:predicted ester cyclase
MNSIAIDNKSLIQEYFHALSGQPKPEHVVDRYVSDPGLKEHIRVAEAAFPEYELIPLLLVAEADLVAAHCTFRGVHKGEFAGVAPTGRLLTGELMIFYRLREGKITEHWMQMDVASLFK